jgi:hypothetical protein
MEGRYSSITLNLDTRRRGGTSPSFLTSTLGGGRYISIIPNLDTRRRGGTSPSFLTSTLDGGEVQLHHS